MWGARAVSWTATDQVRFGSVSASKSCSLSLMTPSDDCAAIAENSSVLVSSALAKQAEAAASSGNRYLNNIVGVE